MVDENTIGVVPTLGVTFTGRYDPVAAIAAVLDKVEAEQGLDIPIHVDAASGGFLAPFMAPDLCGISAAAGPLDQRVRPQVRAGAARGGLGPVA